ncbi:histidine kinase dimerization/phospho-acceptor domain-containing protein [Clostridium magnum]|uniref:histidine kinase n=1 Tax=Clostridium magnum DSM 2767 TaxID=1121326 RepID=A0A162TJY3_9CLOT|nr:hypothetical protein CLMAG_25550 [Clostridium magnum DSM 2767]SHI24891.1 hypothetical protein SAMN02745944_03610 [Clostridium magnum DSM 2767]
MIRSYSEAVYDGLVDEKDTKKYAGEIIKEVDRLNSLVMDLLQLSKLEYGAKSSAADGTEFYFVIPKDNLSTLN